MRVFKIVLAGVLFLFTINNAMAKNFSDNSNGTVTDGASALVWQQGEAGQKTWEAALSFCEDLALAGKKDWRLPNYKELQSLVDYSKVFPVLDLAYFPNVKSSSAYWSSTTLVIPLGKAFAYALGFGGGLLTHLGKQSSLHVRCVR